MPSTQNFEDLKTNFENLMSQGNHRELLLSLRELSQSFSRREERLLLAQYYRRLGSNTKTLELLRPLVHPKGKRALKATAAEELEYAWALLRVGSFQEARKIATRYLHLDPQTSKRILGYSAFEFWDLEEAKNFMKFSKNPNTEDISQVLDRINLLLVLKYFPMSESFLEEAGAGLQRTQLQGWKHLEIIFYQLILEYHLNRRDWKSADEIYNKLKKFRLRLSVFEATIQEKIFLQYQLFQKPEGDNEITNWHRLKKLCHRREFRELHRECDYLEYVLRRDPKLLSKLYWGSISTRISEFLKMKFPKEIKTIPKSEAWIKDEWTFTLEPLANFQIEITEHKISFKGQSLDATKYLGRFLLILLHEKYKNLSPSEVFGVLFSQEVFLGSDSTNRIHQLANRLRKYLRKNQWPLILSWEGSGFRLKGKPGASICRQFNQIPLPVADFMFQQNPTPPDSLGSEFTAKQLCETQKTSRSSAKREITRWINAGLIQPQGKGKNTRYTVTPI